MATTDLEEQIWKDDIERMAEDTLALWRTQFRFLERAQSQGAPVGLLNELAVINNLFKEANARLTSLAPCFPEAEK